MKTKYFICTWLILNLIFAFTFYGILFLLVGEYDADLWVEETKHFYAYVCFIFALVSLKMTAKIISKF